MNEQTTAEDSSIDGGASVVDRGVGGWRRAIWRIFGSHTWRYRNPYDRTCEVCGRNEVSHCAAMESWDRAWWEVWNDGEEQKHYSPNPKITSA